MPGDLEPEAWASREAPELAGMAADSCCSTDYSRNRSNPHSKSAVDWHDHKTKSNHESIEQKNRGGK